MKYKILFFVVFISGFASAQEHAARAIGLNTTGCFMGETFRAITVPQMIFERNNSLFAFGPILMVAEEKAISNKVFPKFVGVQGLYIHYPNGRNHTLNLFLFDELNLQRIRNTWTSITWDKSQLLYMAYKYESIEPLLQNTCGYGMDIALGSHFRMYTKLCIGFYYSLYSVHPITPDAPEISDKNGNGYSPFDISYGVGVGIAYQL